MKKTLVKLVAAASLAAMVAGPAFAKPDAYCANKARNVANTRALGTTVVGAGVGCLLGAVIAKKCGVGAAVGGVGGFAIGSAQWQKVYNQVYWKCRKS